MSVEVWESEPFETMQQVARLTMEGKTELAIAREVGIKRVEVINYQEQWRDMLRNSSMSTDMAHDHLNQMVVHYDRLIEESYKLLSDLQDMGLTHQVAAQINTTLKNISDYEKTRVDLLQKAGILEGAEIGDQLAEAERKRDILIDILKNTVCPDCQKKVALRLKEVTGRVEQLPDDE